MFCVRRCSLASPFSYYLQQLPPHRFVLANQWAPRPLPGSTAVRHSLVQRAGLAVSPWQHGCINRLTADRLTAVPSPTLTAAYVALKGSWSSYTTFIYRTREAHQPASPETGDALADWEAVYGPTGLAKTTVSSVSFTTPAVPSHTKQCRDQGGMVFHPCCI